MMLFTLKEDNSTGNFYLCCLLHVLSMIIKSRAICTGAYYIIMCTDGVVCWYIFVHICYWLFVQQLQYVYLCGYFKVMDTYCIIVCVS